MDGLEWTGAVDREPLDLRQLPCLGRGLRLSESSRLLSVWHWQVATPLVSRAVVRVSPTLQRKLRGHNLRSYYEFYAIFLGCIYIAKFAKGFCKHSLPYWRGV